MKTPDTKPLFTLTAEEVEIMKKLASNRAEWLSLRHPDHKPVPELDEELNNLINLLNKIKNWKVEK